MNSNNQEFEDSLDMGVYPPKKINRKPSPSPLVENLDQSSLNAHLQNLNIEVNTNNISSKPAKKRSPKKSKPEEEENEVVPEKKQTKSKKTDINNHLFKFVNNDETTRICTEYINYLTSVKSYPISEPVSQIVDTFIELFSKKTFILKDHIELLTRATELFKLGLSSLLYSYHKAKLEENVINTELQNVIVNPVKFLLNNNTKVLNIKDKFTFGCKTTSSSTFNTNKEVYEANKLFFNILVEDPSNGHCVGKRVNKYFSSIYYDNYIIWCIYILNIMIYPLVEPFSDLLKEKQALFETESVYDDELMKMITKITTLSSDSNRILNKALTGLVKLTTKKKSDKDQILKPNTNVPDNNVSYDDLNMEDSDEDE